MRKENNLSFLSRLFGNFFPIGEQGTREFPTTFAEFTGPTTNRQIAEPDTKHGHGTLEILLGIILAVLSVILFLLLFRQLIKLKKGYVHYILNV